MKHPIQIFNYAVKNISNDTLEVNIDGEILDASTQEMVKAWFGDETSVSYKSFRNSISQSDAKTINVIVNSPGGHVGDAMAIHDLLVDLQAKGKTVNTKGIGIVASAATYIVMAGNSEMSENSWFMIHNASGAIYGDVNTIENYARTLRKFNDSVRDFYANATGKRKEDITKMMDNESWMTAKEAKNEGFIKQVTGEASFKNTIPKENWQYSNTAVLNAYNSAVKVPQQQDDHKSYTDQKIDEMKKFFTDIVNSIKGVKPAETDDKQAIVNAVADAMQAPLERVGEEIETTITNQVNAALAGDVVTNAVNAAVAPFEQKIADMQAELVNLKGQPTFSNHTTPKEEKPIGSYTN